MPTPEQLRQQRIQQLYNHFKYKRNPLTPEQITQKAQELWPHITNRTARSYATSVIRMKHTYKEAEK